MKTIKEFAEDLSDAYSTFAYKGGWSGCIKMLRKRGYDDRQIEAIIRSKWTRWARDGAGHNRNVYTSGDLARFLDSMKPADRETQIAELVQGTF